MKQHQTTTVGPTKLYVSSMIYNITTTFHFPPSGHVQTPHLWKNLDFGGSLQISEHTDRRDEPYPPGQVPPGP